MKLSEIKNSMMYTACPYKREPVDMTKFLEVNKTDMERPEHDVIRFYLAVQIMGIVELKYGVTADLPEEIEDLVKHHHEEMEQVFFRLFTYIMLISIGESRHGSIGSKYGTIDKKFGQDVSNFATTIKGITRTNSRSTYLNENRAMRTYMEYCEWAFIECFSGGSYGGMPWKNIANKVTQVLSGETSPYTMVDVSWSLVHNTGSIFNKNTIYNKDNGEYLAMLLDIQRGGGMGTYILTNTYDDFVSHSYANPFLVDAKTANDLLGGALSKVVSPVTIKEAGALHSKFLAVEGGEVVKGNTSGTAWVPSTDINLGVVTLKTVKRVV